jgi:soluble lytic murein transglycosylase-like protein
MQDTGMRNLLCVMAALVLLLAWPVANAQIYKYTDANGIVHYTNIKPSGVNGVRTFNFPCYVSDPKCNQVDWEKVPLDTQAFLDEISSAAAAYAVDESLIRAIIHAESTYRPDAKSPKGAQGLMQLMPATAAELQVSDPYQPRNNILGGTDYLAQLLLAFDGDVTKATAAYNAGPEAVRKYQGVPPYAETQEYVRRVRILYRRYREAGA